MKYTLRLLAATLAVALTGCGGGGGGGSSSGTGAQSVGVFVTDSFSDDYDHVWVTLYKVELVSSEGSAQTLFDDPAGRSVDLKTLRDAGGPRFLFLDTANVRPGHHAKVRVTVGSSLMLFPKGATTGQETPVADSFTRTSDGKVVIEFPLAVLRNVASGNDNVVVDFDLANFVLRGGRIEPHCKEGDKGALTNRERHEEDEYAGVVAELSGQSPDYRFALAMVSGRALHVVADGNTSLVNLDATPGPMLANGKRVLVEGTFDPTTQQLTAKEIKIAPNTAPENLPPLVVGEPSQIDASGGTFIVTVKRTERLVPPQTTVNVVTRDDTVFWSANGVKLGAVEFFQALGTVHSVAVAGTFDAATNTLTADNVKLPREEAAPVTPLPVAVSGVATGANADAGSFTLGTLAGWEGFVPNGTSLSVVTNGETRFQDAQEHELTSAAFFGVVTGDVTVRVLGTYSGGALTATRVRLLATTPGNDQPQP
jgi:Domain of unknown function (DUF4382)/Domain of unknown function (DUF5666)